jgi:RNase P protein component
MAEQAATLPTGTYVVRAAPGGAAWGFEELKVALSQAVEKAARGRPGRPGDRRAMGCDQGR